MLSIDTFLLYKDSYQLNLRKGTQGIFYNVMKISDGKGFQRINGNSTFCSRKAAKLAKKNNYMNLLKNLCVFAPLREIFSVPVYSD